MKAKEKNIFSLHLHSTGTSRQPTKPLFMGFFAILFATRTRKFEIDSIQFCIGHLILFGFIFVQLSQSYGLYRMVLSICYLDTVIIHVIVTFKSCRKHQMVDASVLGTNSIPNFSFK